MFLIVVAAYGQAENNKELNQLGSIVGQKKFVTLGEDSHFMVEVHKFVAEAFPYLVEKKGFRVFVFEAAWGTEEVFQDFMNSDRTTVTPEESFYLNAFNSKQIIRMLIWIREWNRKHPNDKIKLAGYHPERPVSDFNALWDYAGRSDKFAGAGLREKAKACRAGSDEFKTNIDFIIDTGKRRRNGQPTYTNEDRNNCNGAIDAIERFIEANRSELIRKSSKNAYLESKLPIISLRVYLNTLTAVLDDAVLIKESTTAQQLATQKKVYGEGDKGRFEIFEILRQTRYKGQKIFFWMHNWHAMKHSDEIEAFGRGPADPSMPLGTVSLGMRMAAKYGKDLVTIGNIVPKAICKNPLCTPPSVPNDSLEVPFQQIFKDSRKLAVAGKNGGIDRDLPWFKAGTLYADINQSTFTKVILSRQFDAVLYLPETTATFEDK